MASRYTTDNIVVAMAGNIDIELAEDMTRKYFSALKGSAADKREVKVERRHGSLVRYKDIEQIHIAIGYPSVKRYDKFYDATLVMNSVLGGSMSSRLFQTVREKLGLAYTVYSYSTAYADTGTLVVYAGVNAGNYKKSVDAIYKCIEEIKRKDLTEEEFIRGKEQLKSSSIFAQESTSSQMLLYGKELIYSGKLYDFEDRIEKVNAVTMDDVFNAIDIGFDESRMAAAVVGKVDKPLEI